MNSWLAGLQSKNKPLNNSQEHVFEFSLRPRERSQSVELLPCKQEDLSSVPQNSNTFSMTAHICNSRIEESGDRQIFGTHWPARLGDLMNSLRFTKTLYETLYLK